ncbi:MAG: VWA domain-containing protein [Alphaproteobacteria bacterium]|nr:VWA domain-containing protein [Alphaproteobacteria bacterium]MCB9698934.1 VWA domain-containing protein [Alphaproteobacteria bacterium]
MNLLFPAGLALGSLAVPLVALYFLKLRRRRVVVPSLLPWQALRRNEQLMSPFQKFRRHLLMLVQLLLLALLVLAFARPFLEGGSSDARSLVVIVDTTASMGATDRSPNRFEEARGRARRIVDGLSPSDEAMVVAAGASTEVVVPFTRDRSPLLAGLDGLELSEAEGGLEDALSLASSLARSRPALEVVVLSDGGGRDLSSVPVTASKVRFEPIGESADNAGIVALDLRRSPSSELARQLFVTARWFGDQPTSGTVSVRVGAELVGLRNVSLTPEEPVSLVFDLDGSSTGALEVTLEAKGDQLPVDDRAFAVLSPLGAREVLLVGADPLVAKILAADPRVHATVVSPGQTTPELLAGADCVLFAGAVPDGVDGLDYAVLGPYPGSPVRFGDEVAHPRIVGWQRSHPILRYARMDDLYVVKSRAVVDGGGLAPVVDGDGGPLVLAGTRRGGRVVQLAFDPVASDLPMRVAWPLLVLDTVGWLTEGTPGSGESSGIKTGTPVVRQLPEGHTEAVVRSPAGRVTVQAADGTLRFSDTDRVGLYEIDAGSAHTSFAANLLSESESRIRPRTTLGLRTREGADVATAAIGSGRRELWRPFLLAALVVLVAEWLLWNRRRVA